MDGSTLALEHDYMNYRHKADYIIVLFKALVHERLRTSPVQTRVVHRQWLLLRTLIVFLTDE